MQELSVDQKQFLIKMTREVAQDHLDGKKYKNYDAEAKVFQYSITNSLF